MTRWAPDGRGRLEAAALELYVERGFDETTVAEIAGRAGLTERTFFRHFADKREVLFVGSDVLVGHMLGALETLPPSTSAFAQVAVALEAAGDFFVDREHSRRRQEVIERHPELRERELIKLSRMSEDLAARLRERGVPDPGATLAAELGLAAFRVAFEQWLRTDASYAEALDRALGALRALDLQG